MLDFIIESHIVSFVGGGGGVLNNSANDCFACLVILSQYTPLENDAHLQKSFLLLCHNSTAVPYLCCKQRFRSDVPEDPNEAPEDWDCR